MKTCTKCKTEKPVSEFSNRTKSRDGLEYRCKACSKIVSSDWQKDNPERSREADAKWRAANREATRVRNAKWRAANPEKESARYAKWYAGNREKKSEASIKWRAANPEAFRIYSHNRRTRSVGKLSIGLSDKLFKLQRGKCACGCKQPLGDDFHLDHIMPLALGGANEDWNIQLLRSTCNQQKHAKHPVDYMQSKGFLL